MNGAGASQLSLAAYTAGMTVAGAAIGSLRSYPELHGIVAGVAAMSVAAVVEGPWDGWLVVWVLFGGLVGVMAGALTGLLARLTVDRGKG
jgi:hypothetical protein